MFAFFHPRTLVLTLALLSVSCVNKDAELGERLRETRTLDAASDAAPLRPARASRGGARAPDAGPPLQTGETSDIVASSSPREVAADASAPQTDAAADGSLSAPAPVAASESTAPNSTAPNSTAPNGTASDREADEQLCELVCNKSAELACRSHECHSYCLEDLAGECRETVRLLFVCLTARPTSEFTCDEDDQVSGPEACAAERAAFIDCKI